MSKFELTDSCDHVGFIFSNLWVWLIKRQKFKYCIVNKNALISGTYNILENIYIFENTSKKNETILVLKITS